MVQDNRFNARHEKIDLGYVFVLATYPIARDESRVGDLLFAVEFQR